jgi:hypothetical protein
MLGYGEKIEIRGVELNVTVNGEKVDIDLVEISLLGDYLVKLKDERFEQKEFIASLVVNGEKIIESKHDEAVQRPLAEVESLIIETDTPTSVSLRTLSKTDEFIQALLTLAEEGADKFRLEDESIANQHFIKVVDGLQTFVDVLTKLKSLNNLDLSKIIVDGEPASKREEALLSLFNALHDSQVNKDWITLADLLEYELSANISEWREIFLAMAEEIQKQNN